jgi:CdiI immunity protein
MKSWESLGTLLGGYLNEDFAISYGTAWNAVESFAHGQPEYAPQLRREITDVLTAYQSEADLERALDRLGLGYLISYDGWNSHRTWLLAVADRVDDILRKSPAA